MKRAARVLFLIAMIAIAIGALGTETSLGFSLKGIDKLVHLGAFFLLALLGALGWPRYRALFLIGLPVLGVAIEALQTLVPSREFSLLDAVMNGIGVGVGVTLSDRASGPCSRERAFFNRDANLR